MRGFLHLMLWDLFSVRSTSLLCVSCSSSSPWRIRMKDGTQLASSGMPELHKKTGYYRYRNPEGKDALVRLTDVAQVERM
jgi:hypothetical protein